MPSLVILPVASTRKTPTEPLLVELEELELEELELLLVVLPELLELEELEELELEELELLRPQALTNVQVASLPGIELVYQLAVYKESWYTI